MANELDQKSRTPTRQRVAVLAWRVAFCAWLTFTMWPSDATRAALNDLLVRIRLGKK